METKYELLVGELGTAWAKTLPDKYPPAKAILFWSRGPQFAYMDDEWGPAVPYKPVVHDDGSQNFGYVRIKGNLKVAAQIPEVVGWPELQHLLETINADSSPLETVGCEKSYSALNSAGDAKVSLDAYIDLIFSEAKVNDDASAYLRLAARILVATEGCEQWWGTVELGFQRLRHLSGAMVPWGLLVRVSNAGRDEGEARKYWAETIHRLEAAVQQLPSDFPAGP